MATVNKNKRFFYPGQELILWVHNPIVPGDIKKHNGEVVRISKVVPCRSGKVSYTGYVECEGVVSVKGIPFAISPDWLFEIGTPGIPRHWAEDEEDEEEEEEDDD
jgi:hypothetical protein